MNLGNVGNVPRDVPPPFMDDNKYVQTNNPEREIRQPAPGGGGSKGPSLLLIELEVPIPSLSTECNSHPPTE